MLPNGTFTNLSQFIQTISAQSRFLNLEVCFNKPVLQNCLTLLQFLFYDHISRPLWSCYKVLTTVVLLFKPLQTSIDGYQLLMYTRCFLCNKSSISVTTTLAPW